MTWFCAFCGRPTAQPAVAIGKEVVGPTCARRANLLGLAKRSNRIRILAPVKPGRIQAEQLNLLELLP